MQDDWSFRSGFERTHPEALLVELKPKFVNRDFYHQEVISTLHEEREDGDCPKDKIEDSTLAAAAREQSGLGLEQLFGASDGSAGTTRSGRASTNPATSPSNGLAALRKFRRLHGVGPTYSVNLESEQLRTRNKAGRGRDGFFESLKPKEDAAPLLQQRHVVYYDRAEIIARIVEYIESSNRGTTATAASSSASRQEPSEGAGARAPDPAQRKQLQALRRSADAARHYVVRPFFQELTRKMIVNHGVYVLEDAFWAIDPRRFSSEAVHPNPPADFLSHMPFVFEGAVSSVLPKVSGYLRFLRNSEAVLVSGRERLSSSLTVLSGTAQEPGAASESGDEEHGGPDDPSTRRFFGRWRVADRVADEVVIDFLSDGSEDDRRSSGGLAAPGASDGSDGHDQSSLLHAAGPLGVHVVLAPHRNVTTWTLQFNPSRGGFSVVDIVGDPKDDPVQSVGSMARPLRSIPFNGFAYPQVMRRWGALNDEFVDVTSMSRLQSAGKRTLGRY